jgi:hypothetical protein
MSRKRNLLLGCLTLGLCSVVFSVSAQDPAAPPVAAPLAGTRAKVEEEEPPAVDRLPKPLHRLQTNLLELEKSGCFRLGVPQMQILDDHLGEAIVWRVEVIRPVNSRYVLWQLEKFRDARFVRTAVDRQQESHATLLYYSPRLEEQAANGTLLFPNDSFDIWLYVAPTDMRKIQSTNADRLILSTKRAT